MDDRIRHIDTNAKAAYIDWLRGEGPKPDPGIVRHVEGCTVCKEEVLELAGILDELTPEDLRLTSRKQNLTLLVRAAAVLIGVTLVALMIQFLRHDKEEIILVNDQTDSVEIVDSLQHHPDEPDSLLLEPDKEPFKLVIQHDTIKYAQNFIPDQGLESLVVSHFRNSSFQDSILRLKEDYSIDEELLVKMPKSMGAKASFALLSNQGKTLLHKKLKDEDLVVKLSYLPGLYYWKMADSEGLIVVGKFILHSKAD